MSLLIFADLHDSWERKYVSAWSCLLTFVAGVEDMVTTSGVEENIGLVTFGGRANVVHNLTNDFSRIRDQIGELCLLLVSWL